MSTTASKKADAAADGFDPGYFPRLAALEEGHWWFENRNRLIVWALRKHFAGAERFLEIGCGTGFVLRAVRRAFPGMRIGGSEMYAEGLDFARGRVPGADFLRMDARKLPFRSEFDVIGAFDVIEHIEEDEQVLARMFEAVRPGGGILLTVPQHRFLWSRFDEGSHHVRRYEARELDEKIRRAGFRPAAAVSFVSALLPAMLLSRRKKMDPAYDVMDDIRISRPANFVLGKILEAERALIRWGARFPAGGSLLVAARKP